MSGTWATIPECLSLAFSLNVVPGNARTEANPLHAAFVSGHPTYEGFKSRAYANQNTSCSSLFIATFCVNSRAHANLNYGEGRTSVCKYRFNSRAYANPNMLEDHSVAHAGGFNFRAKYRRVEKVY